VREWFLVVSVERLKIGSQRLAFLFCEAGLQYVYSLVKLMGYSLVEPISK
jgi:hypothetical protein